MPLNGLYNPKGGINVLPLEGSGCFIKWNEHTTDYWDL